MTTLTIAIDSPLHCLGRDFLQQLVGRLLPALSSPGNLGDDAQEAHDRGALDLLEDLDPRTPVQAALAAQFVTAHYGAASCSSIAMDCPAGSPDSTRLHAAASSLARVMCQTLGVLLRCQAPELTRRVAITPSEHSPAAASALLDAGNPMPTGTNPPAIAIDTRRPAHRMPGERPPKPANPTPADPPPAAPPPANIAPPRLPLTLSTTRTGRPGEERRDISERRIPYEDLHRPDGTYWNEPPSGWPGPSWLADRFPLTHQERLKEWGPKAWDELTPELRRATWGYEHEPGVLEAYEAKVAAALLNEAAADQV